MNKFYELKKPSLKQKKKKSLRIMCHQIKNINKEIGILKKNQI